MSKFIDYANNKRGNIVNSVALMACGIAIAALAGTNLLDHAIQDGAFNGSLFGPSDEARYARAMAKLPHADAPAHIANRQVTLDYMPVGSTPNNLAQSVILDPCTGATK